MTMAGEYVRWLARDVKPAEKKELTPEEKRRNWWAYHKWYVLIGVAGLILAANLVFDAVSNVRAAPDYTITYVGSTPLPEGVAPALEECIAALGEDLNGNGQVQVEVLEFLLREGEAATVFGDSLQLTLNIESGESVLYLLEDPALFAEIYPILSADGNAPYYRCGDCPALASLEALRSIALARREIWESEPGEQTLGALRLFEALTEGAEK
jgi:hypothetical protein